MDQKIFTQYTEINKWIEEKKLTRIFVVCDASLRFLKIKGYFDELEKQMPVIRFDHFQSNPLYESVVEGVRMFRDQDCDGLVAVGAASHLRRPMKT